MCGIVAALPSYAEHLLSPAGDSVIDIIPSFTPDPAAAPAALRAQLRHVRTHIEAAADIFGQAGAAARLIAEPALLPDAVARADRLLADLRAVDQGLDSGHGADATEAVQAALRAAIDAAYGLRSDRLGAIETVRALGASAATPVAMVGYLALASVLMALDRLEVRGRDSAGVAMWVELDEDDIALCRQRLASRDDPLFRSGSVRVAGNVAVFAYKHAAVVGKLGDNGARLRAAIAADAALHRALAKPSARVTVLAHTRWASVGRISEANAHPVDSAGGAAGGPLAVAVLNGDIDNHVPLRATWPGLDPEITTDAKLIPLALTAAGNAAGGGPARALARSLQGFTGSMAIAGLLSNAPGRLVLGVKGTGQGLYIGLSDRGYMVASEAYGVVHAADRYVRLDQLPGAEGAGSVVELRRSGEGALRGVHRYGAAGATPAPYAPGELRTTEISSRDLALGDAQHYLAKEIAEAPASFRKTLRGRVTATGDGVEVNLPPSALPARIRAAVAAGAIGNVVLIGQGTAAVACQGIAAVMRDLLPERIRVDAVPATEFSVYGLRPDLTDTLVLAVSQSGSTTDTNRAVDLARQRGASVVAIVNRRDSDLATKSDGIVYTADGRDVEMAVASTKAFYSQVAAGCLLGVALSAAAGAAGAEREAQLLRALLALPAQLTELHRAGAAIAEIARATATRHQNWAVVGSGGNRVAAAEARIKLSELCYRAVSTDAVEDKKHIDLSAESMVLVCAAGTRPGQVRDLLKEVEIFAAHRNTPVVITDADTDYPWATPHVIRVPTAHPVLAWILSTAAAHLFAYHAALAIDAGAAPLRRALAELERATDAGVADAGGWRTAVHDGVLHTLDAIAGGELNGVLTPASVMRLTLVAAALAGGSARLGDGPADAPHFVRETLTAAIGELSRAVDAVKHQAKTVTVGTSRDDCDLYDNLLVAALDESGADTASVLSHGVLTAVRAHAGLVAAVTGVTRYHIDGATIAVRSKRGSAAALPSRADQPAAILGSKELAVRTRQVRLIRGSADGRIVLAVPEVEGLTVVGLSLLHVRLHPTADGARLAAAMSPTRLDELRAAVTELGEPFDLAALRRVPAVDVLLDPVETVAAALSQQTVRVA